MTTDQLLLIQPAFAGQTTAAGNPAAAAAGGSEGSEAFLDALLKKLKGLGAELPTDLKVPAARQDVPAIGQPAGDFNAFIEQIKVLAGQSALTGGTKGGKDDDHDGNILPAQSELESRLIPLSPQQLDQLVSQLLAQASAVPDDGPEEPASPKAFDPMAAKGMGSAFQTAAGPAATEGMGEAFPKASGSAVAEGTSAVFPKATNTAVAEEGNAASPKAVGTASSEVARSVSSGGAVSPAPVNVNPLPAVWQHTPAAPVSEPMTFAATDPLSGDAAVANGTAPVKQGRHDSPPDNSASNEADLAMPTIPYSVLPSMRPMDTVTRDPVPAAEVQIVGADRFKATAVLPAPVIPPEFAPNGIGVPPTEPALASEDAAPASDASFAQLMPTNPLNAGQVPEAAGDGKPTAAANPMPAAVPSSVAQQMPVEDQARAVTSEPSRHAAQPLAGTVAGADLSMASDLLKAFAGKTAKTDNAGADLISAAAEAEQGTFSSAIEPLRPELGVMPQAAAADFRPAAAIQPSGVPEMNTPLGRPGWSEDLGERVVWMTGKGMQSAQLQLNPQHLGPVEVRINLDQDQASIQFVAHHAGVREAIEAAIPKLREMLGEQQLNLADVSVTQQSFSEQRDYRGAQSAYDQQPQSGGQRGYPSGGPAQESAHHDGQQSPVRQSGQGLLNLYA